MVAITAKPCQRTAPSRWPGGGPMAAAVYAHRLRVAPWWTTEDNRVHHVPQGGAPPRDLRRGGLRQDAR